MNLPFTHMGAEVDILFANFVVKQQTQFEKTIHLSIVCKLTPNY